MNTRVGPTSGTTSTAVRDQNRIATAFSSKSKMLSPRQEGRRNKLSLASFSTSAANGSGSGSDSDDHDLPTKTPSRRGKRGVKEATSTSRRHHSSSVQSPSKQQSSSTATTARTTSSTSHMPLMSVGHLLTPTDSSTSLSSVPAVLSSSKRSSKRSSSSSKSKLHSSCSALSFSPSTKKSSSSKLLRRSTSKPLETMEKDRDSQTAHSRLGSLLAGSSSSPSSSSRTRPKRRNSIDSVDSFKKEEEKKKKQLELEAAEAAVSSKKQRNRVSSVSSSKNRSQSLKVTTIIKKSKSDDDVNHNSGSVRGSRSSSSFVRPPRSPTKSSPSKSSHHRRSSYTRSSSGDDSSDGSVTTPSRRQGRRSSTTTGSSPPHNKTSSSSSRETLLSVPPSRPLPPPPPPVEQAVPTVELDSDNSTSSEEEGPQPLVRRVPPPPPPPPQAPPTKAAESSSRHSSSRKVSFTRSNSTDSSDGGSSRRQKRTSYSSPSKKEEEPSSTTRSSRSSSRSKKSDSQNNLRDRLKLAFAHKAKGKTKRRNSLDSVASLKSKDERQQELLGKKNDKKNRVKDFGTTTKTKTTSRAGSFDSKNNVSSKSSSSPVQPAEPHVTKPPKSNKDGGDANDSSSDEEGPQPLPLPPPTKQSSFTRKDSGDASLGGSGHQRGGRRSSTSSSSSPTKRKEAEESSSSKPSEESQQQEPATVATTSKTPKTRFGTSSSSSERRTPSRTPSSSLRERMMAFEKRSTSNQKGKKKRRNSIDSVASLHSKDERKAQLSSSNIGEKNKTRTTLSASHMPLMSVSHLLSPTDESSRPLESNHAVSIDSPILSTTIEEEHPSSSTDETKPTADQAKKNVSSLAGRIHNFNSKPGPPRRRNSLDSIASLKTEEKRKLPDIVRLSLKSKKDRISKKQDKKSSTPKNSSSSPEKTAAESDPDAHEDDSPAVSRKISLVDGSEVPSFVPKKITGMLLDRVRLFEGDSAAKKGELSGWDWLGAHAAASSKNPNGTKRRNSLDSVASLHTRKHELEKVPSSAAGAAAAAAAAAKTSEDADVDGKEAGADVASGSIGAHIGSHVSSVGAHHYGRDDISMISMFTKENTINRSTHHESKEDITETVKQSSSSKSKSKHKTRFKRRNSLDSVASLHSKDERRQNLVDKVKSAVSKTTGSSTLDKLSSATKKKVKIRVRVKVKNSQNTDAALDPSKKLIVRPEKEKKPKSPRKTKRRNSLDSVASLHKDKAPPDSDWKSALHQALDKKAKEKSQQNKTKKKEKSSTKGTLSNLPSSSPRRKGRPTLQRSNSFDTIESARKQKKKEQEKEEEANHHKQILVGHRPGGFLGGFEETPEMSRGGVFRPMHSQKMDRPDDWLGGTACATSPKRPRKKMIALFETPDDLNCIEQKRANGDRPEIYMSEKPEQNVRIKEHKRQVPEISKSMLMTAGLPSPARVPRRSASGFMEKSINGCLSNIVHPSTPKKSTEGRFLPSGSSARSLMSGFSRAESRASLVDKAASTMTGERLRTFNSIRVLGDHLSRSVVTFLIRHVEKEMEDEKSTHQRSTDSDEEDAYSSDDGGHKKTLLKGAAYLSKFNGAYAWDADKTETRKSRRPAKTSGLNLDSFFTDEREVGSFGLLAANDKAATTEQTYRRQKRVTRTQTSIQLLLQTYEWTEETKGDEKTDKDDTARELSRSGVPPSAKHDCALLFVDISGFTKLSTLLPIEQLSKTINSYFQLIVETVQEFGGDIIKFAGDALFAQWQASPSRTLEGRKMDPTGKWQDRDLSECKEMAVRKASCCAAMITELCSEHPVYENAGTSGREIATLDVHCGVAYGEVLGVYVGGLDRMEYMILGDPIRQVAEAEGMAERGETVASPEVLNILEKHEKDSSSKSSRSRLSSFRNPEVIVSKARNFVHRQISTENPSYDDEDNDEYYAAITSWEHRELRRLQALMSLYVHPVVVADNIACTYPSSRIKAQKRFLSEAELRDVFTVFIMPLIDARMTGNYEKDQKLLVRLNAIMLITNRELARFKGHLRQYIVDDKGVVLIANFGLRGSTFPKMIEKSGIPFATNVKSLLKEELGVDCRMGATFGKVYCGVVGGFDRHEYAVLGPSVNLSARLMANKQNHGFLVDACVKKQALRRKFQALQPIQAKGYADLVPIFEPTNQGTRRWKDAVALSMFVGRDEEVNELVGQAEDVIKNGSTKLVFLTANSGLGKSATLARACTQVEELCKKNDTPHLIWGHVCSEDDLFRPFGVFGALFEHVISYVQRHDKIAIKKSTLKQDRAHLLKNLRKKRLLCQLTKICSEAKIPERFVEIICGLIMLGSWTNANDKEKDAATRYLTNIFLRLALNFDLVVLAIDDISSMDQLSWEVLQRLYGYAHNLLVIGSSRPVSWEEQDIDKDFLTHLNTKGKESGKFSNMVLEPLSRPEVDELVAKFLGKPTKDVDEKVLDEVYNNSFGIPSMAMSILKKKYEMCDELYHLMADDLDNTVVTAASATSTTSAALKGSKGEHIMNTVDSLPKSLRTHLHLGAILGPSFQLLDVVLVMERYISVRDKDRLKHAESVRKSLQQAVEQDILEELDSSSSSSSPTSRSSSRNSHPFTGKNTTFQFAHENWRKKLLTVTLDDYKKDLQGLISSVQAGG